MLEIKIQHDLFDFYNSGFENNVLYRFLEKIKLGIMDFHFDLFALTSIDIYQLHIV